MKSVAIIKPKTIFGWTLQILLPHQYSPVHLIDVVDKILIGSLSDSIRKKYDSAYLAAKIGYPNQIRPHPV